MSDKLRYFLVFLSFCLTLVSVNAGFFIYNAMFNLSSALLISIVFEILRLSTLYSMSLFSGISRFLSYILYFIIASICFSAAVLSFDSQIIQKHMEFSEAREKIIESDLYIIRSKIIEEIDLKINNEESVKAQIQKRLANNPSSKYYLTRLEQIDENIHILETKKAKNLDELEENKNNESWIKKKKAEMKLEMVSGTYREYQPYEKAARELFGLDVISFQKIIGYALGFSIEAGILLLALIAMTSERKREPILFEDDRFMKKS